MSDVGWGSDHLEPVKKRTIPLWLWITGGGCMFAIGALIVVAMIFGPKVKKWLESLSQPEVQWPELALVLPFDAAPEGVTIARWPAPNLDFWRLKSTEDDLYAFVCAPSSDKPGPWGDWLLDPKLAPMFATQAGSFESVEGTLSVQGRVLHSVRFTRVGVPPAPPEPPPTPEDSPEQRMKELLQGGSIRGDGIDLELTPEGSPRRVLIWLMRGTEGETVSDEQAIAFLAPFRIGPQH